MGGAEARKAARGLRELALARDCAARHRCVVPRDRDVDEALEEVALVCLGGAPEILQHLVGREVLPAVDQLEPALELRFRGRL
jgi:hypothetical protein